MTYTGVFVEDSAPVEHQVFTLSQNTPNPFNQATTLSYELYSSGEMSLTVYDMLGRKVSELERAFKVAGVHNAVWNGCDEAGAPLSSGMYFYRAQSQGMVTTGRMTLLR